MTVRELKDILEAFPEDMEVLLSSEDEDGRPVYKEIIIEEEELPYSDTYSNTKCEKVLAVCGIGDLACANEDHDY